MKLVEQSPLFYLLSKIIFIVKTVIISFLMFILNLKQSFKRSTESVFVSYRENWVLCKFQSYHLFFTLRFGTLGTVNNACRTQSFIN